MIVRPLGVLGLGLVLTLAFMSGCSAGINDKEVDKHQVSVGEVKRLFAEQSKRGKDNVILLIDPRPEGEFAAAHIPGARNLQLSAIRPKQPIDKELARYKNLIVYGNDPSSGTARAMVKRLMSNGYEDVALMAGGLYQWRVTGGAIEGTEMDTGAASKAGSGPAAGAN